MQGMQRTREMQEMQEARPAVEPVDAVVLAGGRLSGLFAWAAGTRVKALAPVCGVSVVARVLRALQETPGVVRIVVVGPEAVRDALATLPPAPPPTIDTPQSPIDNRRSPIASPLWVPAGSSALENLCRGLDAVEAGGNGTRRVLVCGADTPLLTPLALADFLRRCPADADLCMPVVRKETFVRRFPGNLGIYVRLVEGAFSSGSQLLLRPRAVRENLPLLRSLHAARKSQLAMARLLGMDVVGKLVRGRLGVPELEARASALTRCRCRAVLDCAPELSYDIDVVLDLWDARRRCGEVGACLEHTESRGAG